MTQAMVAPTPFRPGGPPLWIGGNLAPSLERAGKYFDGWFPIAPSAADFGAGMAQVRQIAGARGRDPAAISGAMYLTVALDDDAAKAEDRLNHFLERYYGQPAPVLRRRQACYAGPPERLTEWLDGYANAGAGQLVMRFAGAPEQHLSMLAKLRHA